MKKIICNTIMIFSLLAMMSCQKFLDAKPESSLGVPRTIQDLEAILNNDTKLIRSAYPASGDIASDYFMLEDAVWAGSPEYVRDIYVWKENAETEFDWYYSYRRIFDTNVVLDYLDQVDLSGASLEKKDQIKGKALFFRAWSYMQLLPIFTPAYDRDDAEIQLGLPLRLSSDINETLTRHNLYDTYAQIRQDLVQSAELLPEYTLIPIQPTKAAAWAALSRLALWMGDYESVLSASDEALSYQHELIDYNELDSLSVTPFELYNQEILFHATIRVTSSIFRNTNNFVHPVLLELYDSNDLRSLLYFSEVSSDKWRFKGDYSADINYSAFSGLVLDELYLNRTEALVRMGDVDDAMATVNSLLETRWKREHFIPINISDADELLKYILDERYKSLAYRKGIRWADLKRLNRDERFAKTLKREVNGIQYVLEPNDLRYTFLIPHEVILESGIEQNPR